jgi:sugar lactone lactonase YvrE
LKTLSIKRTIAIAFIVIVTTANFSSCSKSGGNPNTPDNSTKIAIISLSVSQGSYNTLVNITGTGFSSVTADNKVKFNGKDATVVLATSTKLQVLVPLAAGTGPITLSVSGKTVAGPAFTYVPALVVTTFAGNNYQFGLEDGIGEAAKFREAYGIAVDKNDNMYVTDKGGNCIRKITPNGTVTTLAGNGNRGHSDGLGVQATFDDPSGITVDASGNVFVTDNNSSLIRKINPDGQVTTFAGNLSGQYQDGVGKLAGFYRPLGITIDAQDNLYVVEQDSRLRKITPGGVVTTFAGNGKFNLTDGIGVNAGIGTPVDITIDKSGNLYVLDIKSGFVRKITSSAEVSTYAKTAADPLSSRHPSNLAMDKLGNLYVSDYSIYAIRVVKPDKTISTYAGGFSSVGMYNGPALEAMLIFPQGIAFDAANNLYFTDRSNVRKISVQ